MTHPRLRDAGTGLKARAHAGAQQLGARRGLQHDLALQDVDELVLFGVEVPARGLPAGHDAREVDTEVPEPGMIAKTAVRALLVGRPELLRVARGVALGQRQRIKSEYVSHASPPRRTTSTSSNA